MRAGFTRAVKTCWALTDPHNAQNRAYVKSQTAVSPGWPIYPDISTTKHSEICNTCFLPGTTTIESYNNCLVDTIAHTCALFTVHHWCDFNPPAGIHWCLKIPKPGFWWLSLTTPIRITRKLAASKNMAYTHWMTSLIHEHWLTTNLSLCILLPLLSNCDCFLQGFQLILIYK